MPKWQQRWALCRPGHTKFVFSGQKKFEISGHFHKGQSHKKAFFVISGAYNYGTFRAEAKITTATGSSLSTFQ